MENINIPKKRKLDENSIISHNKKQNIQDNIDYKVIIDYSKEDAQKLDLSNDNEEQFNIEILEVPLEENNSEECVNENNKEDESNNDEQILNEEDYDIEDYLIEPDETDDINEYKYGDFMKHIEESDYTANYGENEDGDYES
jgi:rare lipoprotein A (peptidoglycan hydrolase)